MPIYEYCCASCGFEDEYLQKVSDPLLTDCPECGRATFTKLVSAAGFQLKGNGWYATDFKNSGAKPATAKGKTGDSETSKSGDAEPSKSAEADKKPDEKKTDDKKAEDKKAQSTTGTGAAA